MSRLVKIVIGVVGLFLFFSSPVIAADTLVVKGSTTVFPIAQAAAQIYMKNNPGVNITVSGTGSNDGITALIEKTTEIANASRDLKKEEKDLAKEKGVYLVSNLIAIDAIVPIVHPDNPVKDLTVEQLNLIYQGKINNWKSIGGPNKGIIVISRHPSSGTYDTWAEKILLKANLTPRAQMQESHDTIVDAVSRNKLAIGYIGLGFLKKTVKGIKVNGIEASIQTARSWQYPIARPLLMVTDGQPAGLADKFIKFLFSTEGQKIVKDLGFVPLK